MHNCTIEWICMCKICCNKVKLVFLHLKITSPGSYVTGIVAYIVYIFLLSLV